jgi:lysylphosphatidylglycerol synthetase-like protein (DUF2156 family)
MTTLPQPSPHDPDRQRVLALLKRHGWGAASFQTLGPGFRYWFSPDGEACLAYVDTGGAWVVGGLPIADRDRYAEVVTAFVDEAHRQGRRVRYVTLDPSFAAAIGLDTICFGEMPLWDPQAWDATVSGSRSLKEQMRRARAKGVRTCPIDPDRITDAAGPTRLAMVRVVQAWLQSRRAPPLRFIAQVQPFFLVHERRYVAAECRGELVAFLVAVPVYARGGWMVETIFRTPQAPNGVSELLVDTAMRQFAADGSHYATLGAVPLTDRVNRWLRLGRWLGSPLYNFQGLHAFKAKLRPQRWEPIHIAYEHGSSPLLAFWDVAMAFAPADRGRLLLSLVHAYKRPLLVLLTVLLIPWTLMLASVETGAWFPSLAIQRAWVAFDLGLIVLLALLLRRWSIRLATALAILTAIDGALTAWQAWAYTWARAQGPVAHGVILIAVAGPWLASLYLWLVRRERR